MTADPYLIQRTIIAVAAMISAFLNGTFNTLVWFFHRHYLLLPCSGIHSIAMLL